MAEEARDAPAEATTKMRSSSGLSVVGGVGVTNAARSKYYAGAELRALVGPTRWGDLSILAGYETAIREGLRGERLYDGRFVERRVIGHAYTDLRAGLTLSWGAPWSGRRWGFGLDAGVAAGFAPDSRYGSVFGGAQLRFALCECGGTRPYVAWTGRAIPRHHHGESAQSTGLDLGLAFRW